MWLVFYIIIEKYPISKYDIYIYLQILYTSDKIEYNSL